MNRREDRADRLRRRLSETAGTSKRPPVYFTGTLSPSLSLNFLTSITRRAGFDPIVWKFRLKVWGDCDSDSFSVMFEAGEKISECWHSFVKFQDVLLRYCRDALDANDAEGIDNDSPESLLAVMDKVTRANVISVEEMALLPSSES